MKTNEKYICFFIIFLILCNIGMSIYSLSYSNKGKENYQDYWGYINQDLANYCSASQTAPGQLKFCTDQDDPKLQKCCDLNNCYVQKDSQICMVKCGDGMVVSGDCSVTGFNPNEICTSSPFGGPASPVPLPDNYTCKTINPPS